MPTIKTVFLERECSQRTNDDTLDAQIVKMINSSIKGSWEGYVERYKEFSRHKGMYVFYRKVDFKKNNDKGNIPREWDSIATRFVKAGMAQGLAKFPWRVTKGMEDIVKGDAAHGLIKDLKDYGQINCIPGNEFDHIFDRDHQVKVGLSALEAATQSDWTNRFHTVFYGPPGCGKTEVMLATQKMLGEENDAYLKFDATSTTEAGASKLLLEAEHIPPVLFVEEIEKANESSLRWLLGVLDQRAEIRRTNCRIGNQARNVKMLCMATVNNMNLFRNVMSGALASRFPFQVYCPRPDRKLLAKILLREVAKVKGKKEWIEPALKFCCDDPDMVKAFANDPRKVVPICLCGKDDLLTGKYQESIKATMPPVDVIGA